MNTAGGKCGCEWCAKVVQPLVETRAAIKKEERMTVGSVEMRGADLAEQRAKATLREPQRAQYNPGKSSGRGKQLPARAFFEAHRADIESDLKTKKVTEVAALWGMSSLSLYNALYLTGTRVPQSRALYAIPGAPGHSSYLRRQREKRNGRKVTAREVAINPGAAYTAPAVDTNMPDLPTPKRTYRKRAKPSLWKRITRFFR